MGTRGTIGIRYQEKDYLSYNHYDSTPERLGKQTLEALNKMLNKGLIQDLKEIVPRLRAVQQNDKPSKDELKKFIDFADFNVGKSMGDDGLPTYYQLTRSLQGVAWIVAVASKNMDFYLESNKFIQDSLFCEWGYIINLDTEELEIYKGFQTKHDPTNRYNTEGSTYLAGNGDTYYPCRLIMAIGFDFIRNMGVFEMENYFALNKLTGPTND